MDGFNKEYPNIEVEWQFTDTTAHHQALQTSLSAGDGAPDVAMVEGAYVAQYRDSSALTNLLDEPYNAGELKDDFVAFKWDQCQSADGTANASDSLGCRTNNLLPIVPISLKNVDFRPIRMKLLN